MGNHLSCCNSNDQQYIQKQLKFYQWRADYKRNRFIPRVSFKKKYQLQQQELYTKFVQQTSTNNYINPSQYKNRNINDSSLKSIQAIVFQNYICTLQNIQNLLNIQESTYLLIALFSGFRQLKSFYDQFMVSQSCCFVTNNGEVRSWINYNPKLNNVQQNPIEQTYLSEQNGKIVNKIIQIYSKCSQKNYETLMLQVSLRQNLKINENSSNLYEISIKIIQDYMQSYKIKKCNNILSSLSKIKNLYFHKKRKDNQICSRSPSKIQIIDDFTPLNFQNSSYMNKNNGQMSSVNYNRDQDNLLEKQLKINFSPQNSENYFMKLQTQPTLVSKSVFGSYIQKPVHHNQRIFNDYTKIDKIDRLQQCKTLSIHEILEKSTYPINDIQQFSLNHVDCDNIHHRQAQSNRNKSSQQTKNEFRQNTSLSDYILSESERGNNENVMKNLSDNHGWTFKKQIIQNKPVRQIKNNYLNNHVHFNNTVQQINCNNLNYQSQTSFKPWIHSTRTISKLIHESPHQNNVLISQGSTSSHKNSSSDYSGILLSMGRDISHKIIQ